MSIRTYDYSNMSIRTDELHGVGECYGVYMSIRTI